MMLSSRALKILTIVVLCLALILGGILITPLIATQAASGPALNPAGDIIIANDTFNRKVSNGWGSADQGGTWKVLDTPARWSVSPGAGSINVAANSQARGVLNSISVQNVDLLIKIVLPRCTGSGTNCASYALGRYTASSTPTYYRIGVVQGKGRSNVFLRSQRSDGANLSSDLNTGIAAADGIVLWLRAQFTGIHPTTIHAHVWKDGTNEPATWLLNKTDNTNAEQKAGAVGVRSRNDDTGTAHIFKYQNVQATALALSTPVPSPSPSATSTTVTPTMTPTVTATPSPGNTAAADSFQRTTATGWGGTDTGNWWTVVGSPWSWSVATGSGSVNVAAAAQERAYLSNFTLQDSSIVEKLVLPRCGGSTNCDSYIMGRYSPAYNPTYYRVGLVQGASRAHIFLRTQRSDGTNIGSDLDTGLPASDNAVVWLRVEFMGVNPTTLHARAWLDGSTEPSTWTLNTTDSNSAQQKAGMVGLRFSNEDTAASHIFQVQSYQVTGTATPVSVTPNPTGSSMAHWVYVVNDGTVYAYDIDANHALVKTFPIPEAGKRGVAVAVRQGLLYISECGTSLCGGHNGSLIAYDLVNDVVLWIANYAFGIDQFTTTPDGSTIYMPHGSDATDGTTTVIDASSGKPIGSINTGTNGHNTIASLDGTQIYLGGYTGSNFNFAHVVDPATNQVILNAGPTINGVRPFTINGKHTLMFTTSTNTCGFQVLSLTTGQVLYTVPFSGSCTWIASDSPSHGISISPDEQRIYIMDAPLDKVKVYDISGLPASAPVFVADIQLSSLAGNSSPCQTYCEREGWVLNDLSGRYVYVGDTGDVIDTTTLTIVASLPALKNTRMVIEIDWMNSAVAATSTRFGLGYVTG